MLEQLLQLREHFSAVAANQYVRIACNQNVRRDIINLYTTDLRHYILLVVLVSYNS